MQTNAEHRQQLLFYAVLTGARFSVGIQRVSGLACAVERSCRVDADLLATTIVHCAFVDICVTQLNLLMFYVSDCIVEYIKSL